jgi:hypothetical protein
MAAAALAWGAIVIASLCLIAPGAWREINVYDEGVSVYGAMRVAGGEVPYRDFWTIYAPGDLYLLAALLKLCGSHLIVERHAWVVLEAILATLVFAIGRRLAGGLWGAWCWSVTLMWTRQVAFWGSPVIPAMVCSLGAILAVLAFLDRARTWLLVTAGVLVGLGTLFRQDFGLYTFVSLALALAVEPRVTPRAGDVLARRRHPLVVFTVATVVTLAPPLIVLFSVVPASLLVEPFIIFPFRTYAQTRALSWPALPANPLSVLRADVTLVSYLKESVRSWQFYVSIGVLSAATIWSVAAMWMARPRRSRSPSSLFIVGATGFLLLSHALVRSDVFHIYPSFVFALIVGAAVLACVARSRGTWTRVAIAAPAVLFVVGLALLSWRSERLGAMKERPLAIARAAGLFTLGISPAYDRAIAYVQLVVPPGEAIFVGNRRHDRILVNDVLFYFLAARASATRYHDMHPGVATTARVQEEIVRDLERKGVTCVILWDAPQPLAMMTDAGVPEPEGSTRLDQYIAEHFTPGPRFDAYQVWQRKPSSP